MRNVRSTDETSVRDTPLTPAQQEVLRTLDEHPFCTLARSTARQLAIIGTASTHRLAIKGYVEVDFQYDTAVLTERGRQLVGQIRRWRNARPVDVQALVACRAHVDGPPCGRCHQCGGKLRTMLSLSCQRCGSSDADE